MKQLSIETPNVIFIKFESLKSKLNNYLYTFVKTAILGQIRKRLHTQKRKKPQKIKSHYRSYPNNFRFVNVSI